MNRLSYRPDEVLNETTSLCGLIKSQLQPLKSNQIRFIFIAPNHNNLASADFTTCTVNDILCPQSLELREEKLHILRNITFNREKKETSGRAPEEGSLSQDGQRDSGCHMYRTTES